MHITTDNDQMDKVGEAAQTMSRATQNSAYTAMDYALKTQEMNTRLLQQTSPGLDRWLPLSGEALPGDGPGIFRAVGECVGEHRRHL